MEDFLTEIFKIPLEVSHSTITLSMINQEDEKKIEEIKDEF